MSVLQQCPGAVTCPGTDSPIINTSAEGPEGFDYFSVAYGNNPPPLGFDFKATGCLGECDSKISQMDADQCAAKQAYLCANGQQPNPSGPPPGSPPGTPTTPPVFFNRATGCTVVCPDGTPFTAQLPAGVIAGRTQVQADSQATADACSLAHGRKICLSALDKTSASIGDNYTGKITATGTFLAQPGTLYGDQWSIIDGVLPDGLNFNGGSIQGGVVTITGTPTAKGTFAFVVQVVDPLGDFQRKQYTITVGNVPPTVTLPWGGYVNAPPNCTAGGQPVTGTVQCKLTLDTDTEKMWTGTIMTPPVFIGPVQVKATVFIKSPKGQPIQQYVTIEFQSIVAGGAGTFSEMEYDAVSPTSANDPSGNYLRGNLAGQDGVCSFSPVIQLTITTP